MNINGTYDFRLVALSVVIAIVASYAALDLTARITATRDKSRIFWLFGGASAMGLGIWCMHYIGMLAFRLPMMAVFYDIPTVAVSLLAAIAASGVALFTASRRQMQWWHAALGGVVMGSGISAMHYIGMAAMRMQARVTYILPIVWTSIVLAVIISIIALILAFRIRDEKRTSVRKIATAVVMGSAIPVMHYTGMLAARFTDSNAPVDLSHAVSISALGVAVISASTLLILSLVIAGAFLDRLISTQKDLTQQARIELRRQMRALVESEERLRLVTENARVGLVVIDAGRRYIYANKAYSDLLALPSIPIIGQSVADVLPDIYEKQVRGYLDRAFAGERVGYELFKAGASKDRQYEIRFEPTAVSGSVSTVVMVLTDITERKNAELASLRLAAIVEFSDDAIIGKDLNSIVTSWNRGAEKLFGYTSAEMVGSSIMRLIPADRHEEENHIISEIKSGRSVEHFETQRQTKDGRRINVSVTASPIRDAAGNPVGISKVAQDITERKQSEKKLRQSEEMFGKAFRNSPLAMSITTSQESRYLDVNDAFLRMLQYQRGDVIGKTSMDLCFWVEPAQRAEMFRVLGASGQLRGFRLQGKTSRQEVLDLEVFAELIDLGGQECLLAITRDITEVQRLEAQLRQAQKMEAVGLLAGGVAHDFNNLLGVIMGYSDLALDECSPDEPRFHKLQQIKKAGLRATSLTRQLLAFSRKQIFQPQILDINALVSDFNKMLLRMVGEDIELVSVLKAGVGHIKADPGQIEQVIMNLVVNSRDAMPQGGKLVIETANVTLDDAYCRSNPSVQPGDYVMVAVSDTGVGMDAATQTRIFEPFFTTKERGKGTGLGLSTVYGVLRQSEGHVQVYSELGKGTTLKMYFPRVDEPVKPSRKIGGEKERSRGTETILLVEDAELFRTLTRTLLETNGYRVLTAQDGAEAIKVAESTDQPIDLLLTDVVMPGMSGKELADYLAQRKPEMRVLYMSGYTNDLIAHQGILDTDVHFIEKPFSQDALASKLRELLGRQQVMTRL